MPPSNAQNGTTVPDAALAAADITLYDADTGTNRVVSVRDFLIGAAACEMPPTWNDDTLLAQMVASHSYALALGAPMQVNSALCAGWTDTEVLEARWGDDFTAYYSRFAALADEAAGALLCYGGAPAAACYHSISNGVTEASQNVWTSALPYLQGVASPWDQDGRRLRDDHHLQLRAGGCHFAGPWFGAGDTGWHRPRLPGLARRSWTRPDM